MAGEIKNISIVVPVFNAAPALIALQAEIDKIMVLEAISYKLILVDDGSEDNSWEVMKAVKNKNPEKVIAIRMSKNYGQHNAIFVGFRHAKGEYIITMDDDLQHPPDEIPKLLKCAEETNADLVYGISKTYKRSPLRKFLRWGYRLLNRMTADDKEGSAFRVIKKDLVDKLITHDQEFVFIDELTHWYTEKIEYIKVRHDKSHVDKSRYPFSRLSKLYYNLVFGYNAFLLRLITFLGCTSSAISILIGLYFIIKKIFFHVQVGFTGIVVSITFTGGIILLSIGIIGEYMRRMYNIMNAKPQSSVSEILE
jgi:glycosyltransferase involved in cell wall biosynthesis